MPSEPANPRKYSLQWAGQVVEQLRVAHPRATEHVLTMYGITLKNLASYLARGDPVYKYLKSRIHYFSRMMCYHETDPATIQLLSEEGRYCAQFAPEKVRERLDKRFKAVQASRAGSEGLVSDQSEATGGDLPSGFFQFTLFPELEGYRVEV